MAFNDELNKYIEIVDCTSAELAASADLSTSLISRYRSGKRIPKTDSQQFYQLVEGLLKVYRNKGLELDREDLEKVFRKAIYSETIDFDIFHNNFNRLIHLLDINISKFAAEINYDASFISRIKSGTRKPADLNQFSEEFCNYIIKHYTKESDKVVMARILGIGQEQTDSNELLKEKLFHWLQTNEGSYHMAIDQFLKNFDNVNSEQYMDILNSKLFIPSVPMQLVKNKLFYGINEMRPAETKFMMSAITSKSESDVFLFSEMPMNEIIRDEDLKRKWMIAMSLLLKRGRHLNIIHDIHRPLNEILLGLESWLPLYMLGDISPYYFEKPLSEVVSFMHCTCDSAVLTGECLKNNPDDCRLYYTTQKDEIKFFHQKSAGLLSQAKPLMKIFREQEEEKFLEFMEEQYKEASCHITKISEERFRNIDFYHSKGKWMIINKLSAPVVHFVIYNTKLRNALEKFLKK